jgi:ABC-type xylose transport system permease subunit
MNGFNSPRDRRHRNQFRLANCPERCRRKGLRGRYQSRRLRGFTTYAVSPLLAYIASGRVVGIPIILLLAIALTAAASWLMHGTVYGRQLSAVGQNSRAAYSRE